MIEKYCAGCNNKKMLQNSHIIPEFFYRYVYTKDHKFILISSDNEDKLKISQKGFREKLLCKDCENYLAKFEKITAEFFNEIVYQKYNKLKAEKIEADILKIEKYNYLAIKKCLLSILWRASISTLKEFSDYDLGKENNEKIKQLIFSNEDISWKCFPILITKVIFGNKFCSDVLFPHKKGQYKNILLYSMTLAGFNIDYFITENFDNANCEYIFNDRFCNIKDIHIEDLKLEPDLINRLGDKDVDTFYQKHEYT